MKCFLVTGAAGFIGAAVARALHNKGHRVITIDNCTTGQKSNVPKGVEFFEADCQDPHIYSDLPDCHYDAIFHIAGQSSGEISFDDPVYDLRTNAESTLLLLKFALKQNCTRFIYASTMSVYGKKPDRPISEKEVSNPESFYGVGKVASEQYLRLYQKYGIEPTCLRLFNVYGPGQNMTNLRQGMVSIFMAQMLKNNAILVKGEKDRFRDFVYIDDVVNAFLLCLSHRESIGHALNIASGVRTSVEQLLGKMTLLHPDPVNVTFEGTTPGDVHGIYADISCAHTLLKYTPATNLSEGLKKMYSWARNL